MSLSLIFTGLLFKKLHQNTIKKHSPILSQPLMGGGFVIRFTPGKTNILNM